MEKMKETTTSMSWISLYWILLLERCPEFEPLKERKYNFYNQVENVYIEIYLKHECVTDLLFPQTVQYKNLLQIQILYIKKAPRKVQ